MVRLSLSIRLLLAAIISGIINGTTSFIVLYVTNDPILSILWLNIFGAIVGFITNSYVYHIDHIIWIVFLRWIIITCLLLFLTVKLYKFLDSLEKVKELRKDLTGIKLNLLNYSLILGTTWIIFVLWVYGMTKNYVFINLESKAINTIDVVLLCITACIVGFDQYITHYNSSNESIESNKIKHLQ